MWFGKQYSAATSDVHVQTPWSSRLGSQADNLAGISPQMASYYSDPTRGLQKSLRSAENTISSIGRPHISSFPSEVIPEYQPESFDTASALALVHRIQEATQLATLSGSRLEPFCRNLNEANDAFHTLNEQVTAEGGYLRPISGARLTVEIGDIGRRMSGFTSKAIRAYKTDKGLSRPLFPSTSISVAASQELDDLCSRFNVWPIESGEPDV